MENLQPSRFNFNFEPSSFVLYCILTYWCESLFSVIKFIKSKQRATLTNEHLGELIRTALTTYRQNFQRLANQTKD